MSPIEFSSICSKAQAKRIEISFGCWGDTPMIGIGDLPGLIWCCEKHLWLTHAQMYQGEMIGDFRKYTEAVS